MNKQLTEEIEAFLSERRKSRGRGGWAKITKEDVDALYSIIHLLIELKCETDADGAYPINVILVNRLYFESLSYSPIPYDHISNEEKGGYERELNQEEQDDRFDLILYNLERATKAVHSEIQRKQSQRYREKLKKPDPKS